MPLLYVLKLINVVVVVTLVLWVLAMFVPLGFLSDIRVGR